MNLFPIIMDQILLFVILVCVGILAIKTKVLNQESLGYFSRYLMRIAIPVLIFYNTIHGATRKELIASLPVLFLSAAMFAGLAAMGYVVGKMLRLKGNEARIYQVASTFGNIGFMGIPLVSVIFPETGMLYIALFTIIDQGLLWTVGMSLTCPAGTKRKTSWKDVLKKMISPATVSIVLAIVCVLIGVTIPKPLDRAMSSITGTTSPLSMIYIGGLFCSMNLKQFVKKVDFYVLVLTKMIFFPVVFYLILKALPFGFAEDMLVTITILSGLPQMITIPMFAAANGSNEDYAAGALMITTICAMFTLPLLGYVLPYL